MNGSRRLTCALGLMMLLASCGTGAEVPDPRSASLRLADLPRGATTGPARYWNDGQAAKRDGVPAALYRSEGRIRSYSAEFDRNLVNGLAPTGIVKADSETTVFRTVRGAHWYFLRLRSAFAHGTVLGTTTGGTRSGDPVHEFPYHVTPAPRIGAESAAFFADWSGDEFGYDTRTVILRRNAVVVVVRVTGLQDQLPLQRVVTIVRRIESRIPS